SRTAKSSISLVARKDSPKGGNNAKTRCQAVHMTRLKSRQQRASRRITKSRFSLTLETANDARKSIQQIGVKTHEYNDHS
ncbi:MAG TPA: hypothetical protein VN729_08620, partial [Ktedonobacteraceae bacterium]|nr:hypothetical protein [Ktedonobacteraceae bacterium]